MKLYFNLKSFILDEKEIWLHEGCAVWNSNIYIKDNQVFGISSCLKEANKLVF